MKNIMKLEIRKALCNKMLLIAVLVGCGITIAGLIYNVQIYQDYKESIKYVNSVSDEVIDPCIGMFSLFNHWIGGEPFSSGSTIYYFLFPLLVAIPYGWSYCEEKKNGYVRNIVVKVGKLKYFTAKYVAVFLAGSLTFVIPLIFNLAATALFIPAIKPDVLFDTGTGVFVYSFMSKTYYTMPYLYIFLYLCIDFAFGGLIACISYGLSSFIRQKVVVVLAPFGVVMLWHYLLQFTYISREIRYDELSPLYYLRPAAARYPASGIVMIIQATFVLLTTLTISLIWERKHEIY